MGTAELEQRLQGVLQHRVSFPVYRHTVHTTQSSLLSAARGIRAVCSLLCSHRCPDRGHSVDQKRRQQSLCPILHRDALRLWSAPGSGAMACGGAREGTTAFVECIHYGNNQVLFCFKGYAERRDCEGCAYFLHGVSHIAMTCVVV